MNDLLITYTGYSILLGLYLYNSHKNKKRFDQTFIDLNTRLDITIIRSEKGFPFPDSLSKRIGEFDPDIYKG